MFSLVYLKYLQHKSKRGERLCLILLMEISTINLVSRAISVKIDNCLSCTECCLTRRVENAPEGFADLEGRYILKVMMSYQP